MLGRILVRAAVRGAVRSAMSQRRGVAPLPAPSAVAAPQAAAGSSGCLLAFLVLTAIGGIGFGLLFVAIGIGMNIAPTTPQDPQTGATMAVLFFILLVVPGLLALLSAIWIRRR